MSGQRWIDFEIPKQYGVDFLCIHVHWSLQKNKSATCQVPKLRRHDHLMCTTLVACIQKRTSTKFTLDAKKLICTSNVSTSAKLPWKNLQTGGGPLELMIWTLVAWYWSKRSPHARTCRTRCQALQNPCPQRFSWTCLATWRRRRRTRPCPPTSLWDPR